MKKLIVLAAFVALSCPVHAQESCNVQLRQLPVMTVQEQSSPPVMDVNQNAGVIGFVSNWNTEEIWSVSPYSDLYGKAFLGEFVVSINGKHINGRAFANEGAGPVGTWVELVIMRPGYDQPRVVRVRRKDPAVFAEFNRATVCQYGLRMQNPSHYQEVQNSWQK